MAQDIVIQVPSTDLSDEASLTAYMLPAAPSFTGIFLLGANAAQTGKNRVKGGVDGAVQGTPVYGSGYARFNGDEAAQSRLDTGLKQGSANTFYAAFKPVSATIDINAQPVILSTGVALAATNQNGTNDRTSNGIGLYASQDGYMTAAVSTYNPSTGDSLPITFALTGQDFTRWNFYVLRIGSGVVQLDNLSVPASDTRSLTAGYSFDRNVNRVFWGDSATVQTARDGVADHGIAAIATAVHTTDQMAAMYAQFKTRMSLASPAIAI